jgi:hypothetical protein
MGENFLKANRAPPYMEAQHNNIVRTISKLQIMILRHVRKLLGMYKKAKEQYDSEERRNKH